jgi:hypothetical protein
MRLLVYIASVIIVFGLVVGGFHYTQSWWIAPYLDPKTSQINPSAIGPLIVTLPAAVSAIIVGLLNGVSAILVQKEQRAANLALEAKKGAIIADLEDHKDKNALKRAILEESLDQMKQARDTAAQYRFAIGNMRHGTYLADEALPLRPKLESYRDSMRKNARLHDAWAEFVQLGHYLDERATGTIGDDQKELWNEPSAKYGNQPIGVVFAKSAEVVSGLIGEEIQRIRGDYLAASRNNNP